MTRSDNGKEYAKIKTQIDHYWEPAGPKFRRHSFQNNKIIMLRIRVITCFLFFSLLKASVFYAQNIEILFSLEDVEDYRSADTLYLEKDNSCDLYFYNNSLFYKKKQLLCFKNVDYYMQLVYLRYKNHKYIYIYPHYFNQVGPYIWYGYGVLIELNKEPLIKENIDYFDSIELSDIFKSKEYIIRKSNWCKCIEHQFD